MNFGSETAFVRSPHLEERRVREKERQRKAREKTISRINRFHAAQKQLERLELTVGSEFIWMRGSHKHLCRVKEIPKAPRDERAIFVIFEVLAATTQWHEQCFFSTDQVYRLRELMLSSNQAYPTIKERILKKFALICAEGKPFYKKR